MGVKVSVAYIGVLFPARGLGVPSAWGLWWEERVGAEEIALSRNHLVSILSELILEPFSWSPACVQKPLELYARKQYDLSNWASGRRRTP